MHILHHKSRKSTIHNCFKNGDLILMLQSTNEILKLTYINPLKKRKYIVLIVVNTGQHQQKKQFSGLLFLPLRNIMQIIWKKGLISSLLKVFAMFEIRLSYKEEILDIVSLNCINCKRETGLDSVSWRQYLIHTLQH